MSDIHKRDYGRELEKRKAGVHKSTVHHSTGLPPNSRKSWPERNGKSRPRRAVPQSRPNRALSF